VALGDRDTDGVPDVYVLAAGDDARLRVARGGAGFEGVGGINTGVAAHDGVPLQIADYDGDGRDDLVFAESDGALRVYLGGVRSPGADLTTWFSGSWDRDWSHGDGCMPNPGFETEPGFTGTRYAVAGPADSAFAFPNPETGRWTVTDRWWAWWTYPEGALADLEPVDLPSGPGYAVLRTGAHGTTVELLDAGYGAPEGTVTISDRMDPVDLAVVEHEGSPALAVAFAGDPPVVLFADLTGEVLSEVRLAGIEPSVLVAAGGDRVFAAGSLPGGALGVRVASAGAGMVAQTKVRTRRVVEDAAFLAAWGGEPARVAVLVSHVEDRNGRIAMVDALTGETTAMWSTMPLRNGVIAAVATDAGPTLVTAARNAATGRVRVDGRDPATGARLWGAGADVGFDPADADVLGDGTVAITTHRFGDGNVAIDLWDPATGAFLG
jgi:hypothetical protein